VLYVEALSGPIAQRFNSITLGRMVTCRKVMQAFLMSHCVLTVRSLIFGMFFALDF
jgi:hypothetical protein